MLHNRDGTYYVADIFYGGEFGDSSTIQLVDQSLDADVCSILPKSLVCEEEIADSIFFMSCRVPMTSSLYIDAASCANASFSAYPYFYALFSGQTLNETGFDESCTVEVQVPRPVGLQYSNITGLPRLSISDIHRELLRGYNVSWGCATNVDFSDRNRSKLAEM
ncbi:hypothetical protein V6N11_021442 [Hibiscus sabdariffa]|uniref:Uncharacterized protein n=1 Tax=Hibiscus sabdariffa TaxID=183260 RepID=A0ABR2A3X6_9ROSI